MTSQILNPKIVNPILPRTLFRVQNLYRDFGFGLGVVNNPYKLTIVSLTIVSLTIVNTNNRKDPISLQSLGPTIVSANNR